MQMAAGSLGTTFTDRAPPLDKTMMMTAELGGFGNGPFGEPSRAACASSRPQLTLNPLRSGSDLWEWSRGVLPEAWRYLGGRVGDW